MKYRLLAFGAVLMLSAGGYLLSRPADGALVTDRPPATVMTQTFAPKSEDISYRLVAVLRPRRETPYAFQVAGRVEERLVQIGDHVRAGQALARLERVDFDLAAHQASAELAAANQALETTQSSEKRVEALRANGVTSIAALDAARSQRQEAQTRLDRAKAQLDLLRNSVDYTTLRANADGIVTARDIEQGQVVGIGQAVLTIAETQGFEAEVHLPENLYAQRAKLRGAFTSWANPGPPITATLAEVNPKADPATYTYRARFVLDAPAGDFAFGNTGWLTVTLKDRDAQLLHLPASAIFDDGSGSGPIFWQVGENSELLRVPAQIRRLAGDNVWVAADITQPVQVVVLGASRLSAGQTVRAISRAAD